MNYRNQLAYVALSAPSFLFISFLLYPFGAIIWGIGGLCIYFFTSVLYKVLVVASIDTEKNTNLRASYFILLQLLVIGMLLGGVILAPEG